MTPRQRLKRLEAQQALRIERAAEIRAQVDAVIDAHQVVIDNLRAQLEWQGGLRIA